MIFIRLTNIITNDKCIKNFSISTRLYVCYIKLIRKYIFYLVNQKAGNILKILLIEKYIFYLVIIIYNFISITTIPINGNRKLDPTMLALFDREKWR